MNDSVDNGHLDNQGSKAPFGVNFIRKCILILAIFLSLWIFFELIFGFSALSPKELGRAVLVCVIDWMIFYGLRKLKSWVVILILISSYFAFLLSALEFFQINIVNGDDLLKKFFQLCFIFFFAFQIVIFSRSETKRYFKEKGTTII
jgi:hypothetical protein